MEKLPLAQDMPWPPTPGVPYRVQDLFGEYVEVVAPGAITDAERLFGERTMRVADDEWNADFTHRTIRKIAGISSR